MRRHSRSLEDPDLGVAVTAVLGPKIYIVLRYIVISALCEGQGQGPRDIPPLSTGELDC
jgi:hypothetical protein